ncbi:MAG: GntR family transcriptional regulator [Betaproteobacteria bacterium]|nr:GntR family transcriptional regulator [Betaproteobacteria bacterium]MCC6249609.1 GntR family transcriptional regulator [Rubrivivax sp.]MCL4698321.1 GntR family transcriptional regulator [Burkholderiaceae bacterium]
MPALPRPQALSDQVYLALRERLRSGAIGVGEVLQEVPLAAQLGVSRTPVREAMARLASEGLLATERRSFAVPALSLADVDDIYELRFLLEPAAIRRVAARAADRAARAPVESALAMAQAAHRAGDATAFREAQIAYRQAWLKLVPNTRLVRVIELYADHMQHIRALTLGAPRVRTIVLRGLKRITAALAAGDADAAEQAVREHLQQARLAFIEALGLADRPETPAARAPAPASRKRAPAPRKR